jgi:hypothetical protein
LVGFWFSNLKFVKILLPILWHQTHNDADDDVGSFEFLMLWCLHSSGYTWSWFVIVLFYEMCFDDRLQSLCLGMAYD